MSDLMIRPAHELLKYARQKIHEAGLGEIVSANVYEINEKREYILASPKDKGYNDNSVTVSDPMAWFDCANYFQIDQAIDLFKLSPKADATPSIESVELVTDSDGLPPWGNEADKLIREDIERNKARRPQ